MNPDGGRACKDRDTNARFSKRYRILALVQIPRSRNPPPNSLPPRRPRRIPICEGRGRHNTSPRPPHQLSFLELWLPASQQTLNENRRPHDPAATHEGGGGSKTRRKPALQEPREVRTLRSALSAEDSNSRPASGRSSSEDYNSQGAADQSAATSQSAACRSSRPSPAPPSPIRHAPAHRRPEESYPNVRWWPV